MSLSGSENWVVEYCGSVLMVDVLNRSHCCLLTDWREDQGYRLISEQVSHHPPVSAFHAQSLKDEFEFHGSIYPKLKFWGKSVEAEPKGTMTLELLKWVFLFCWHFHCLHVPFIYWLDEKKLSSVNSHHRTNAVFLSARCVWSPRK